MKYELFLSHAFGPAGRSMPVEQMRRAVNDAAQRVGGHEFNTYVEEPHSGSSLPNGIRSAIRAADLVVADLAGNSPNVLYEVGYAHGLGKPLILFTSEPDLSRVPVDLLDLTIAVCPTVDRLSQAIQSDLTDFAARSSAAATLGRRTDPPTCLWFAEGVREVEVVCATEPEMSQFGRPDAENFLFIDQLEDRDALLDVSMFISRTRPGARLRRHASHSLAADVIDGNVVVLGGPLNNHLTRDLMRMLKISLTYRFEDESAEITWPDRPPTRRTVDRSEDGLIQSDIGYFGRFRNPYNADAFIILCQGFHTFGTLGAVALFGDDRPGLLNQTTLQRTIGVPSADELDRLEVFFSVDVMANRRIAVPSLSDCDWSVA